MKTALAWSLIACVGAPLSTAQAASTQSLWPTRADREICDPIFAQLDAHERGTLMAQAQPAPERPEAPEAKEPTEAELATELSALLQGCSYDGKAIKVDPRALSATEEPSGVQAVQAIMRFTGLPQNFRIMEGDVANAAAMVVLGPDGIPQRVIAYNAGFMEQVRTATENNDWSPVSIMAHEIGHHLSGHTLVPGGSQPPLELEADKFSGFVLYKMGAALDDAQKAISTLIPEADGPTHPGRARRLAAVESGWSESCAQQDGECDGGTQVAAARQPQAQTQTAAAETSAPQPPQSAGGTGAPMPDIPGVGDIMTPAESQRLREADAPRASRTDRVPTLDAAATPGKFDRFVYDEAGIFGPSIRDRLQNLAYRFAAAANVEIVTIVAKDLQGRSADRYALDAMRQLRVGKLDVGNGAVLVVAPDTGDTGVALGAGLLVQYDTVEPLRTYLQSYLKLVAGGADTRTASQTLADASYRIMRDTQALEWQMRYASLEAMAADAERMQKDRDATGAAFDPAKHSVANRLLSVEATVVAKNPDAGNRQLGIKEPRTRHTGPAMHVRTESGRDAVLYVNPSVPALMPVPLEEGKRYRFIVRNSVLVQETPQLDLISYDLLE